MEQTINENEIRLPSGAILIINGSPSIDNCKEFIKHMIKASSKKYIV